MWRFYEGIDTLKQKVYYVIIKERKEQKMMSAKQAYEASKKVAMESKAWRYLEERIEWHANQGHVQMSVSFDYNPQAALHMLRELGYNVAPQTIDKEAHYYSFIITWF